MKFVYFAIRNVKNNKIGLLVLNNVNNVKIKKKQIIVTNVKLFFVINVNRII